MSINTYLWIHLAGISLTLLALGGIAQGGDKGRKLLSIAQGVGLLLVFISGFGMLARLEIHGPWPGWVFVKMAVWLVLGGSVALFKRMPERGRSLWWAVWGLFLVAAYMAIHKPF